MAITLGSWQFDPLHTRVTEKHEEVGGRDERVVTVSGLLVGAAAVEQVEAQLDAILASASREDYSAALSVRTGRRLWVRRDGYVRQVSYRPLVGSFTLTLKAKNPIEEAEVETVAEWPIAVSGATCVVASAGNAWALPCIQLVAQSTAGGAGLVNPCVSDALRTITYLGTVPVGSTLVFDGPSGVVTLDGDDVTPYTEGDFPRVASPTTTLEYTDAQESSHHASGLVTVRDRWW